MSSSRSLRHCTQFDSTGLSTDCTGMFKDSLCSAPAVWSGLSFLFLWWNLSTPHNSSHSPTMSQPNKGGISVAHSASGIKGWKTFFSLNISSPIFQPSLPKEPLLFIHSDYLLSGCTWCVLLSELYTAVICVFRRSVSWTFSPIRIINWTVESIVPGLPRLMQLKRHCLSCITFILNNYKWVLSSSACFLLPMWGPSAP